MWSKNRPLPKLALKMFLGILASIVISILVYTLLTLIQIKYINYILQSATVYQEQIVEIIDNLQDYITKNHLKISDRDALRVWDKKNGILDIQLIYDNSIIYDSLDYIPTYSSKISNIYHPVPPTAKETVTFSDGTAAIYTSPLYTQRLEKRLDYAVLITSFLTFCILLIWQLHRLVRDIVIIDNGIRQLESGDLSYRITIKRKDELEDLADSINRISTEISRQITQEKEGKRKNYNMVTSVSHDIRTPLTSIIGYAQLMQSPDIQQEKSSGYLEKIIDRAYLIKDMTDHLFWHFLHHPQESFEHFEVIIGNDFVYYVMENMTDSLRDQGFDVTLSLEIEKEFFMKIDTVQIRRVFNNIEGNLIKYADQTAPLLLRAVLDYQSVRIEVRNQVATRSHAESSGVGMKTCMEIVTAHGGSFEVSVDQNTFSSIVSLPVYHPAKE